VLRSSFIAGMLALALASIPRPVHGSADATWVQGQAVEMVLLRPEGIDPAALLDALQLRSPKRALAVPPWPPEPAERYDLFAVATVRLGNRSVEITVVLSDGRAYHRALSVRPEDAPRLVASTIANLLAAIEEDELPPDEEDVPLPLEESQTEATIANDPPKHEHDPKPEGPKAPDPLPSPPFELETIAAGAVGLALGPPSPGGFAGGGAVGGFDLRWPTGALLSLAVRSHWQRPAPLTVGRTRISVGGGYAWRRGRFELRSGVVLDIEPWGVRRSGARKTVAYPDGERRRLGLQLGGHLRVVPALRVPLNERLGLRIGPRFELAGSGLTTGRAAGVARLVVMDEGVRRVVARVGGLELVAGVELGLSWALPTKR